MTQIKNLIEAIPTFEPILDAYIEDIKNSVALVTPLNITSDIDFFTRVLSEMKLPMHYMVKNVIIELIGVGSRQFPNAFPIIRAMFEANVTYIKPYIVHGISIVKDAANAANRNSASSATPSATPSAAQPAASYPAYRNDMTYDGNVIVTFTEVFKCKENLRAGSSPATHPNKWELERSPATEADDIYELYRDDKIYNSGDRVRFTQIYKFKERIGAAGYNPRSHPDSWIEVLSGGRRKAKTSRRLKRKSKTGKTKSR
jgi:hypothetical protein